ARNEVDTEKEYEAKSNLGTLNRAQQAFHLENSVFAQELDALDARPSGQYFTYQVVPQTNSKSAIATATPIRSDLKSYTGFAFILGSTSADYKFVSGICETNNSSVNPPTAPSVPSSPGELVQCPPGSSLVE
ncbi:MAG: type IV pilin-like G/H family protein, partial [Cyanobacteria bacterium P01_A01_bin.17]